jgi:glycosyltransferase involved in cell wall biosynthesis
MHANEQRRVSLILGSDPAKDKDAVGQYTEILYEQVAKIAEHDENKLSVRLVLLQPPSFREWWMQLSRIFEHSDLVHIEYPFEGWGTSIAPGLLPAIMRLLPKHRHTKIVTTFHEWRTMHPLRKASVLPLALFSDGLLFVSEQERSAYCAGLWHNFHREQETGMIPIGINVTLPELSEEEIIEERERLLNCKDTTVEVLLCCFGFIYAAKQPYKALRALKVLLDRGVRARLVFAGDFPADHLKEKREFLQQIETLGLGNYVLLLGFLDDAVLTRVISACDAVLLLFSDGVSARRGSFWTVLELGIPLITTRPASEGEFHNLLPEAPLEDLVFVDANEAEERLADIIARFARFRVPKRRSGISPDWERIAGDHVTFYHEVLGA